MIYNIADRIRFLREQYGMTQTDLANKLGISRSAVNSWEMSLSSPSIANIIEMAKLFNISTDYILSVDEKFLIDASQLTVEQKEIILHLIDCFKKQYDK